MDVAHLAGLVTMMVMVFAVAFFQLTILTWTILIGVSLLLLLLAGYLSPFIFIVFTFFYLLAALFANLRKFRQQYLLKPLLPRLQAQIPQISKTEKEALEAGHTWWEKELFMGRPNWQALLAMPKPALTQEEQFFLDNQTETLCAMLNNWEIVNQQKDLPPAVWDYLKKEKFFGLVIPKQYGGLGFSTLGHSTIIVKLATRCLSAAVNAMVPNSLGPSELLQHYGTEEQKSYYLPRLANGQEVPCFALTAPDAGSDAGAIPDTGVVCRGEFAGKEILGIRLNWDKRYITLAPIATVLGLAFHLYDPEHLLGEKKNVGITLCLIPTTHPGVEIGNRHYPMQMVFMNGPTRGKDVFIPLEWVIGGTAKLGQGWKMLMECLSIGRSVSLPALSTSCAITVYRYAAPYARIRRQFNTPIAHFEGIEEALGNIAAHTYLMEAMRTLIAGAIDQGVKPSIASAIAKYHMTEMSRTIITHAMDIHAGHAIQIGPRNYLAYMHFASPISITVEGANILTRNLIIFGQGAIRCHPYLLSEIKLLAADTPDVAAIDQVLMNHIGYFANNFLRTLAYGLTGGWLIRSPLQHKKLRKHHKQLSRMSTAFALIADASLILLGGSLKRRERISARLGDILGQLYLSSAALKYFYDHHQAAADVDYVAWIFQYSLAKIQQAIDEVLLNYPNRWLGRLLRIIVFPYGRAYRYPKDRAQKKLLKAMLNPSELRTRLLKNCYFSQEQEDLGHRLEIAFQQLDQVEPLYKKLHKEVKSGRIPAWFAFDAQLDMAGKLGVFTENELHLLAEFETLRKEIIKVNEFSFDLSQVIA